MKIEHRFNSKKATREYLEARGWVKSGTSLGDTVMSHKAHNTTRVIVQLRTRKWRIDTYPAATTAITMDKPTVRVRVPRSQITLVGSGRINPAWSKAWDRGEV